MSGDGPGSRDDRRATFVDVVELLAVVCSFALGLDLGGHGRSARAAHSCDLGRLRTNGDSASAAVIGDASVVVDDDGVVVDVGDVDVHAVDGAIVVEVIASPIAAVIAEAGVAEAIVDAAVEADVGAPVSAIEAPAVVVPTPVTGGPEGAIVRRKAPGAGNPVVADGTRVPVAGGPNIVGRGGYRLVVDGKWRGRLVGVFDGRALTLLIELFGGLGVLKGLILIGWGRGGLLRRVLFGSRLLGRGLRGVGLSALLGLGLGAGSEHPALGSRCWGCGRLAVVDWGHIDVGGIWAGVVGSGSGIYCTGVAVAACCSDDYRETK